MNQSNPPLPAPGSCLKRLQDLNRKQPKAALGDVKLAEPMDLIVLATKRNGATCRLPGKEGVLTLRGGRRLDVVPGRILTLKPTRIWVCSGHTYLSGEQVGVRFDPRPWT